MPKILYTLSVFTFRCFIILQICRTNLRKFAPELRGNGIVLNETWNSSKRLAPSTVLADHSSGVSAPVIPRTSLKILFVHETQTGPVCSKCKRVLNALHGETCRRGIRIGTDNLSLCISISLKFWNWIGISSGPEAHRQWVKHFYSDSSAWRMSSACPEATPKRLGRHLQTFLVHSVRLPSDLLHSRILHSLPRLPPRSTSRRTAPAKAENAAPRRRSKWWKSRQT